MTLKEFIKNLKEDYNIKKSVDEIETIVKKHARKVAQNGVAAVDDDTVKDWIINADNEPSEPEKPKEQPKVKTEWEKTKSGAMKIKEPPKEPVKKDIVQEVPKKEYEQTSLFDDL